MSAWRYPSSPYRWAGYYLAAPCHRDVSWVGRRATITSMRWGAAAIYVGQQDWTQIPADLAPLGARVNRTIANESLVTCSATLLSNAQGAGEAADAVAKMLADGFAVGSTIFLDVEYVTNVTPALLDHYQGWIAGVLRDGRYRPGVYAAKSNAQLLYDTAIAAYRAAGRGDSPPFWIASSVGFAGARKPSDVGLSFAQLWQGQFDVTQQFNGVSLIVDVDLATSANPSANPITP